MALLSYIYPESYLILQRVLFIIDLTGIRLARAVSTFGLVALHLVCAFFFFKKKGCERIVCFGFSGLHLASAMCTFGLVAFHLLLFSSVARISLTLRLVALHLARVLFKFG